MNTSKITHYEKMFLVHSFMMNELRSWAVERSVAFVDVIAGLDQRRDVLVSHVHLTPEGNNKIAALLAKEILRQKCPSGALPADG